ncbi:MAG: hypothetical protein KF884_05020 [Fimbriimonadaceae bacterium]|nr:hypothetical protein [Fimbriimonadaceae bacterium]QYK59448.1 MAG: hypothetical protein KF884_05020 [Fimbriimonadaceae bacterium]
MAKSVDKIKAALKLRTEPRENSLSLRIGTKKYVLPFEVRTLQSTDYIFVHIPPSAEILRLGDDGLAIVSSDSEAANAAKTFRKSRKRTRSSSGRGPVELPEELKAALSKVPAGHKISYTPDGKVKLVKARRRRKATA